MSDYDFDESPDILVGDWEPYKRPEITLPDNLPREVHRLVWHLMDIGCTRSPFLWSPDCLNNDPPFEQGMMCSRCRALRPYWSEVK